MSRFSLLRLTICWSLIFWSSHVTAQKAETPSDEQRTSLLAERDKLWEQANTAAKKGESDKSLRLLDQVFQIEQSVFGKAHEEPLGTLSFQARIAHAANDWAKEIEFRRRALKMAQSLYQPQDFRIRDLEVSLRESSVNLERTDEQRRRIRAAMAQDKRAGELYRQGQYVESAELLTRVLSELGEVLGKNHPDYVRSLDNLAGLNRSMGNLAKAEQLNTESTSISKIVYGKYHPNYTLSLSGLARIKEALGKYDEAESLFQETIMIRERVHGKRHPTYAQSLSNLAILYMRSGKLADAEPLLLESEAIEKEALGTNHPSYATTINNLAGLSELMGDYEHAEQYYLEAKAIWESELGKNHPRYGTSLNNLAMLYEKKGDYARAEPLLIESKSIAEKSHGKNSSQYVDSLSNLAQLYGSMGDQERAIPLLFEAKSIEEKTIGRHHPDYVGTLSSLARAHYYDGQIAESATLFVEANQISESIWGKNHLKHSSSLNDLAGIYRKMGDYGKAEALLLEAIRIHKAKLGERHPGYAGYLANLGALYHSMHDYQQAETMCAQGLAAVKKSMGDDHPEYARHLHNLAGVYDSQAKFEKAYDLHRQSVLSTLRHLADTSLVQSEQQQLQMTRSVRDRLDGLLRCCIQGELKSRFAVELAVHWKGAVLRRMRALRNAADDLDLANEFRQLRAVATQIAITRKKEGGAVRDGEATRRQLHDLSERQRKLEAELMAKSRFFRVATETISFDQIRRAIPSGGKLVDFLEYDSQKGRSIAASVIDRQGDPVLLDLGLAAKAAGALRRWRISYGTTPDSQDAGRELRRQVWEPLLKHIADSEIVLVSNDGILGRLPLAALPGSKPGTYLLEDHHLVNIPVPQLLPDLVAKDDSRQRKASRLLLVGDVDYDAGEIPTTQPTAATLKTMAATRASHGLNWPPLKETRDEVDSISELFQETQGVVIVDLRARQATEAAFRHHAPECQLLHLATHGFFAPEGRNSALSHNAFAESNDEIPLPQTRRPFVGFSPGQLSGLVFAGANLPPAPLGSLRGEAERDDGIMTADEIAYLPLEGVSLAVLSACETGLGEVAGGEGLIGIQRAFQVAGADSVVATMWKVDDAMTRKLMERFYLNLWEKEMSRLDALRDAQLWVLNNPSLVNEPDEDRGGVRKKKPSVESDRKSAARTSPYYWAPFVLSGDWR